MGTTHIHAYNQTRNVVLNLSVNAATFELANPADSELVRTRKVELRRAAILELLDDLGWNRWDQIYGIGIGHGLLMMYNPNQINFVPAFCRDDRVEKRLAEAKF